MKHAVSVLADMPKLSHNLDILHQKHIEFADNVASRLMKLEELLTNSTSNMRAIVFVQTQNTAQLLFQYLVKTFPTLHPKIVLGHGGYHGMSWDEEQKPAIKDFKQGKTNLLVATSVLEEGLDVSECDLVVRYSGNFRMPYCQKEITRTCLSFGRISVTLLHSVSKICYLELPWRRCNYTIIH